MDKNEMDNMDKIIPLHVFDDDSISFHISQFDNNNEMLVMDIISQSGKGIKMVEKVSTIIDVSKINGISFLKLKSNDHKVFESEVMEQVILVEQLGGKIKVKDVEI
jgi:hypothetical protein